MINFLFTYSSFLSFFSIACVCCVFYFITKRNQDSKNHKKGNKDDLWHIIKEYLKMDNRHGYEILNITLYQRPNMKDMNEYIYKAKKYLAKETAKNEKTKYITPKKEKFYEIEKYFLDIENETKENLHKLNSNIKNRRRYVVCFRVKNKQSKEISKWECIEIELFKNIHDKSDSKFKISFNKKLDYLKELQWIYPMQDSYIKEKIAAEEKKIKEIQKNLKKEG